MYPIRWVCPCVCVQAACKCIRPMHALCYIFLCSLWWGDLSWINFCCFGQLEFSLNLSALEISGWYTLMCAASRTCALVWPLFCRAKYSLPVLLPPMLPHPHAAPLLPVVVSHWGISVTTVTAVKRCNIVNLPAQYWQNLGSYSYLICYGCFVFFVVFLESILVQFKASFN